jgi:hypothetical protein
MGWDMGCDGMGEAVRPGCSADHIPCGLSEPLFLSFSLSLFLFRGERDSRETERD